MLSTVRLPYLVSSACRPVGAGRDSRLGVAGPESVRRCRGGLIFRRWFDVVIPFKQHYVTDLLCPVTDVIGRSHRRNIHKAHRLVHVDTCQTPLEFLDEWCDLYGRLAAQHGITGLRAFSRAAFEKQLGVPGLVMFRALADDEIVGLHLWYVSDGVAYGHLGATSARGYELIASYALYWYPIQHFRERVRWLDLGGGAGAAEGGRWTGWGGSRRGGQPAGGKRSCAGVCFSPRRTSGSRRTAPWQDDVPPRIVRVSSLSLMSGLGGSSGGDDPLSPVGRHLRRPPPNKDYRRASRTLMQILRRVMPGARTLLDVGCGTGRHLEHLRGRFHVEGLDLSRQMLAIARKRCPGVRFHQGTLVDFNIHRQFDVITCLFGAIGYAKTFRRPPARRCAASSRHLRPGGVVVVEPWITPEKFIAGRLVFDRVDDADLKVARMYITKRRGAVFVFDSQLFVATATGVAHFTERQELGLFTDQQYRAAFRNAGLRTVAKGPELFGYGL